MPISFQSQGSFKATEDYLRRLSKFDIRRILESGGERGVRALAAATPIESGLAAHSWTYKVSGGRGSARITWMNTDVESGFPVAIMLQYGYGTGTGGYVQGRDYINPAMAPIFDQIANEVMRVVNSR
jgi:hypothetical protein